MIKRTGRRPQPSASGARRGLAVLLVLLVAFGLRMVRLQDRDLWYDEAFAVLYASLSPEDMLYGTVTPVSEAGAADVHPLLYYFSLHSWIALVGASPLAARFLSVVLGMATVAMLWRLVDWVFDRRVGLTAAMLAAANPFHVAYSQEARMYALLALASVVAAWGLMRALAAPRSCWWVLYILGAALALYAHNLGAFHIVALHLLVVANRDWRRRVWALLLADLAVLLLFLPWLLAVLPGQLGFVDRGYWVAPPGADELARALMLPIVTFYEPTAPWLIPVALFTGLLIVALLAQRSLRRRSRAGWFLLLAWAPILLLFVVSLRWSVYLERALLPSALFYLAALGWLVIRGRLPRAIRLTLAGLIGLCVATTIVGHYVYSGFPRPPFAESVRYLEAELEPGDAVVHTNKLTYLPMHVYGPELPAAFLADPPGSPQDTLALPTQEALGIFATSTITEAAGTASRLWLVYFEQEIQEMEGWGQEHGALRWTEERFQEMDRRIFTDLVVVLFERADS